MFFWIDGNATGNELWRILDNYDDSRALIEATRFSRNINAARYMLKCEVVAAGAEIILDGGDDLLFWVDDDAQIDTTFLSVLYYRQTGYTCKIACGKTMRMVAEEMKALKGSPPS